jgi:hypothetical protein
MRLRNVGLSPNCKELKPRTQRTVLFILTAVRISNPQKCQNMATNHLRQLPKRHEYQIHLRSVLPKLFSTATQFLDRQSIATHIALLDKKVVLKRKKNIFIYYQI